MIKYSYILIGGEMMKIGIIGGGACGLVLANILEENNIKYELFERNLVGRKILASGNGKANIANRNIKKDSYNNDLGYLVSSKYQEKLFAFFDKLNLFIKSDSEGRIYPYSESSSTVLNCLLKRKLNIVENVPIHKIDKISGKYYLNDVRGPFDYLVLATGSFASFIKKKQEGFFNFLNNLDINLTKIYPSLVGFKVKEDIKRLNGVRLKAKVSLFQGTKLVYEEKGELIFKVDGISGICVMNLSSYYARLNDKSNCSINIDLASDINNKINSIDELEGLLNPKLADYIKMSRISDIDYFIHNFNLSIIGVYDYEFAQVLSGGIDISCVDKDLRLVKEPNIFVGGELLDVDGICGGYNLMFAFCSGLLIGEKICNIK